VYAQMSGSGSAFFGIFMNHPEWSKRPFGSMFYTILKLGKVHI